MTQTKEQIIESLYKAGKITFQEAMTLSSPEGTSGEPEVVVRERISEQKWIDHKEEIINEYLDKITYEYYDEDDPKHEVNYAFDVDKCIKVMKANNWKWLAVADGGSEVPDRETFTKQLRHLIRTTIDNVIAKRQAFDPKDVDGGFYYSVGTGGIEIAGWIENDEDGKERLVIEARFVLEETQVDLDPDKFAELLK